MSDGGYIMKGESNVKAATYIALAHGLGVEINTGMRLSSRGSAMQAANRLSGSTKRTKRGALIDYVAWLKETVPGWEPSPGIRKAMEK